MANASDNPWMERLDTVLSIFSPSRKTKNLPDPDQSVESGTDIKRSALQQETQPLSKEMFDERVTTFSPLTWAARPANPLECARYGWKNTDLNILKCVTCSAVLCGETKCASSLSTRVEFSKKFRNRLEQAHQDFCSWPTSPSPESFLHLPAKSTNVLLDDLRDIVTPLLALNHSLPSLDSSFTLDDDVVTWLLEALNLSIRDESKVAMTIALLGWRSAGKSLTCVECKRTLGLCHYLSNEAPTKDANSDEPAPPKQMKRDKKLFSPEVEHHSWCPWVDPEKGWKVYFSQLNAYKQTSHSPNYMVSSPKYASMRAGLNSIRKLLDVHDTDES